MIAAINIKDSMLVKFTIDAGEMVPFAKEHLPINYDDIQLGGANKVSFHAELKPKDSNEWLPSRLNLYKTKRGDKRLSIQHLNKYASHGDKILFDYATPPDKQVPTVLISIYNSEKKD